MVFRDHTTSDAFTLIELLVVLSLIAIVIGIAVPAMDALQRSGRGAAAANSISTATNAAQIYSHRIRQSDLGPAGSPYSPDATYSGTAALFTPLGEIRLVVNDQAALDQEGEFIEGDDSSAEGNAYNDIAGIDYIRLPRSAYVVGVRYCTPDEDTDDLCEAGALRVLPPPFAVRFNEYGHVATDEPYLYYDSNYKGHYDTENSQRPNNYNPDDWSREQAPMNHEFGVRLLPFDRIETVNAVISFNAREFYNFQNHMLDAGNDYDEVYERLSDELLDAYADGSDDPHVQRLADNSTPINFSPLTGLAIRASGR